jgi:hypothetical protein
MNGEYMGGLRVGEDRIFEIPPGEHELQLTLGETISKTLCVQVATGQSVVLDCKLSGYYIYYRFIVPLVTLLFCLLGIVLIALFRPELIYAWDIIWLIFWILGIALNSFDMDDLSKLIDPWNITWLIVWALGMVLASYERSDVLNIISFIIIILQGVVQYLGCIRSHGNDRHSFFYLQLAEQN